MENETEGGNGKEGTLSPSAQDAIGEAARANVDAVVEVAKSAVSSFVDRSTRKKATSRRASSKRGMLRWS